MKRSLPLLLALSLITPSFASAADTSSAMAQRIQERLNQRLSSASASSTPALNPRPRTRNDVRQPVQDQETRNLNSIRDRVLKRMFNSISSRSSASSRSSEQTSSARSVASSSAASVNVGAFAQEVLNLVNAERAAAGLPALTRNALLERSASRYAEEMRGQNHFDHIAKDGDSPTDRIKAEGYPDVKPCGCNRQFFYGENIARGQTTPAQVMRDWMNSPGHKANILSKDFREIGIGISEHYWVQNFGGVWER